MNELSASLRDYLERCGLPKRKLVRCNRNTRMYHDLGLYGDIAEAYLGVLVDHYGVDLSGFEFEKFFPPEFAGKNTLTRTLLWLIPFAGSVARRRDNYLPLTLEMIDRAIRSKRLGDDRESKGPGSNFE